MMNQEQLVKEFARNIADKIKVKGWLNWVKNAVIEAAIVFGWQQLKNKSGAAANEFVEFIEAYLTADLNGMIDEAGDLLAAIFKMVFYPGLAPGVKATRAKDKVFNK